MAWSAPSFKAKRIGISINNRPSACRRGYDAAWRKIRLRFLALNPLCEKCQRPAEDVDHRTPLARGGTHDFSILRPLCHRCHSRITHNYQTTGVNEMPR